MRSSPSALVGNISATKGRAGDGGAAVSQEPPEPGLSPVSSLSTLSTALPATALKSAPQAEPAGACQSREAVPASEAELGGTSGWCHHAATEPCEACPCLQGQAQGGLSPDRSCQGGLTGVPAHPAIGRSPRASSQCGAYWKWGWDMGRGAPASGRPWAWRFYPVIFVSFNKENAKSEVMA